MAVRYTGDPPYLMDLVDVQTLQQCYDKLVFNRCYVSSMFGCDELMSTFCFSAHGLLLCCVSGHLLILHAVCKVSCYHHVFLIENISFCVCYILAFLARSPQIFSDYHDCSFGFCPLILYSYLLYRDVPRLKEGAAAILCKSAGYRDRVIKPPRKGINLTPNQSWSRKQNVKKGVFFQAGKSGCSMVRHIEPSWRKDFLFYKIRHIFSLRSHFLLFQGRPNTLNRCIY